MNLFSRNSIILYSLLGLVSLFLAGFIRNLLQFDTWLEVFITSSIIIPMYIFARKIFSQFRKKNFLAVSLILMEELTEVFQKHFPKIRDRKEGETTPEYLNHINEKVNTAHRELLKLSPFYKISETFNTSKPLSLKDIKEILNEVQKHNSS